MPLLSHTFNGEIDEKIIAEASGHRSLKALRAYEHTYQLKLQNASRIINEESKPQQGDKKQDLGLGQDGATTSVIPGHAFSGSFSNCTINISMK